MNYKLIYDNFIAYCQTTTPEYRMITRNKNDFRKDYGKLYVEEHHIIPKALGGIDEKNNLVILLPEEHLFAHKLRYKAYSDRVDFLAVRFTINGLLNNKRYKDIPDNISNKIKSAYSWMKQNSSEFRKIHGWQTEDGVKRISESRKNTFPVKCSKTGEIIGSFDKNHPKILSGEWVHHSTRMKTYINIETNEKIYCCVDSDYIKTGNWKSVQGEVIGIKNPRYNGMTNENVISRCEEVFNIYNYWNYNITRLYCKLKYDENIPSSFGGTFRENITTKNIQKLLTDKFGATDKQFGSYAKHHTNKIKEEIENEFKN